MVKKLFILATTLASVWSVSAMSAQAPTQEQIQMFQNLPASQKQELAKQYGLDFSLSKPVSTDLSNTQQSSEMLMTPRDKGDVSNSAFSSSSSQSTPINEDETLKRFGIDLFAASPTTFAPIGDAPIPSNYLVGPGDELIVQLFGKENDTYSLIVNRQGEINFPSLGPIPVAGKSFTQVKGSLTQRINEQMIGMKSDISLGKLRSMQVFVMGDAYKPGAYTVSALTTISQALYYSGGFSDSGSLRDVQLKRNGNVVRKLDLYNLLLNGDSSNDVRLMPGDVVLVGPVTDTISIKGEVNRPAIYEMKSGETFQDLMNYAGGLTSNAYMERVQIKRIAPQGLYNIRTLDFTDSTALKQEVQRGDQVIISKASGELKQYIELKGDVAHPGYVEWKKDIRISDIFHSLDTAFNTSADVDYAIVVRKVNPQHNIRVYQFSLANALLNPSSSDNMVLQSHDQILVFNHFSEDMLKHVTNSNMEHSAVAKNFEQAREKAKQQENEVNTINSKWLYQESEITQEQVEKLKKNSRRTLLSQVLLQLRQQSVYGYPAQISEISGEVKHPGVYPITQRHNVKDLIIAAGGLTQYAYINNAELTRNTSGKRRNNVNIIQFNLNNALIDDQQDNLEIYPNDRVNILEQPGMKEQNRVILRGEVRFPGTYMVRKGETLGELLQRAGGLTEFSYPKGAIFTRESLRLKEEELLKKYVKDLRSDVAKKSLNTSRSSSSMIADPDKTLSFISEAAESKALGRLVIQLEQIEKGNLNADVPLEDGDFLFVPTYHNTISIMGEVQVDITYLLDPRLNVDDYIEKAGGMKKQADKERIFIIRADGSVSKLGGGFWFGHDTNELVAGDTIVVPVDTDYRDSLSVWTAATQILYQTGVAINALK